MEHWIVSRGFTIVAPEDITISNYKLPPRATQTNFYPTSIDVNLPHIVEKLFQGTVSVRVLQKTISKHVAMRESNKTKFRKVVYKHTKQLFLFVRDVLPKKCTQKEIIVLCARYVPLADCIFFSSGMPQKAEQLFIKKGLECKHEVQLMALTDATFDKLEAGCVPKYVILNEAEICELEARLKTTRDHFPRMHANTDSMARFLGLKPGMVVKTSPVAHRIVIY